MPGLFGLALPFPPPGDGEEKLELADEVRAGLVSLPLSAAWAGMFHPVIRHDNENPRAWWCLSLLISRNDLFPPPCTLEQGFFSVLFCL